MCVRRHGSWKKIWAYSKLTFDSKLLNTCFQHKSSLDHYKHHYRINDCNDFIICQPFEDSDTAHCPANTKRWANIVPMLSLYFVFAGWERGRLKGPQLPFESHCGRYCLIGAHAYTYTVQIHVITTTASHYKYI